MNSSYLSKFNSVLPEFKVSHESALKWLRLAYGRSLDQRGELDEPKLKSWIEKYSVSESQISERYTEIKDFTLDNFENNFIFNNTNNVELGVDLTNRMKFYDKIVNQRLNQLLEAQDEEPYHFIHTTCTGYLSPSPVQRLCSKKGWHKTEITHAYHMGCYASMPSVRLANALSADGEVKIFNSELCTLHFSTKDFTPEQLIVQSLFADGHILYNCSKKRSDEPSLKILSLTESRIPDSEEDMTWVPGSNNFNMSISRDVPMKLALNIHDGLSHLFEKVGKDRDDLMKNAKFAIHPGGPKILDQVSMLLELKEDQIKESRHILKTRGNMSSATLPHIWKEILENKSLEDGQKVVSLAFGPGLSLFGSVFEICK